MEEIEKKVLTLGQCHNAENANIMGFLQSLYILKIKGQISEKNSDFSVSMCKDKASVGLGYVCQWNFYILPIS